MSRPGSTPPDEASPRRQDVPGAHAGWSGLPPAVHAAYEAALARRTATHEGALRTLLEQKLSEARAAMASGAVAPVTNLTTRHDADAVSLAPHLAALPAPVSATRPRPGLLAELTARLNRAPVPDGAPAPAPGASAAAVPPEPPELNSLQRDRAAWARLSVDQEVQRALAQVPDNPGPLNPHLLVLRSLRQMQALSPAYLARFVSQVETLIWLEQASFGPLPARPALPAQAMARRDVEAQRRRPRAGKVPAAGRA